MSERKKKKLLSNKKLTSYMYSMSSHMYHRSGIFMLKIICENNFHKAKALATEKDLGRKITIVTT